MLFTIEQFKLMKCTIIRQKLVNFEFDGSNTSQKSWQGGNKRLEKVSVTKNKHLEEHLANN